MSVTVEALLDRERTVECLECGYRSPAAPGWCENCEALLVPEPEDIEESVNVVDQAASQAKLRNIDKLQGALEGVLDGTAGVDEYDSVVAGVYKMIRAGIMLSKTDVAQKKICEQSRAAIDLIEQVVAKFEIYLSGVVRMRRYTQTRDVTDAQVGFAIAYAAASELEILRGRVDALEAKLRAEEQRAA